MNTPVLADPKADEEALEEAYATPFKERSKKLFPASDWNSSNRLAKMLFGFGVSCLVCGAVIGLLTWLASIGG